MTFFKFLRSRTPIIKPTILVLFVCIFQFNCEKNNLDTLVDEETQLESNPNEGALFQYVTNNDIPNVINSIKSYTGQPSSSKEVDNKGIVYNDEAYIDFHKGMKVKDNEGITNYTFKIFLKNAPPNEFYNLIQTEDAQGNLSDPFVIKYVLDDDALDDYLANNKDFSYFKGKTHIISFSDFFDNIDTLSSKGSLSCGETVTPLSTTQGLGFSGNLQDISSSSNLQTNANNYTYPTNQNPIAGYSHTLSLNNYDTSINYYTSSYASTVTNNSVSPISVATAGVDISIPTISGVTFTEISVTTYTTSSQGYNNPDGGGSGGFGSFTYVVFTWTTSTFETIVKIYGLPDISSTNTSDKQTITSKGGCPDAENSFFAIYDDPLEEVISGQLEVSRYNNTELWEWLNKNGHPGVKHWELFDLYIFLNENTNEQDVVSPEAVEFGLLAIEAMDGDGNDDGEVDFDELYIETLTPDDGYLYQGPKQLISNPLVLDNGDEVTVNFGITNSDNVNANQLVSVDLVNAIKFAIEEANSNLSASEKITSIYIMATTNGEHSPTSNHANGTAIDISRINSIHMAYGVSNQIIELQKAFDNFIYIRENFGPHFKHKFNNANNSWNYNYPVGGHKDHIHISVRR